MYEVPFHNEKHRSARNSFYITWRIDKNLMVKGHNEITTCKTTNHYHFEIQKVLIKYTCN